MGAAFAADGSLVMVSAADNYGGQEDVNDLYAARSTDLGNTWTFTVIHRGEIEHTYTTDDGSPEVGGEHYSLVAATAEPCPAFCDSLRGGDFAPNFTCRSHTPAGNGSCR